MFFKDVIGQTDIKQRLVREVQEERVPHARLIVGPEGSGKLPLAVAYARYLCCTRRGEEDACGVCPSCVKFNKLVHPDLHFVFPVIKKKGDVVSDDYIKQWRQQMINVPYFSFEQWLETMVAENQQALIYEKESSEILRKLTLKSSEGGYKIMIIWLPEKMHVACSNKLLKLIEEPPAQTVLLLVSEAPDQVLPTIVSRTQRITTHRLNDEEVMDALYKHHHLSADDLQHIAHYCSGNYIKALAEVERSGVNTLFFDLFVRLMRLSYQRKVKEMKEWSEQIASLGREQQKNFLAYCQRMVRENFIYNFHRDELTYMNGSERNFAVRFAPYINERNAIGIMNELNEAQLHIEQNVNPRMVFFDFSLKMIVLLIS